MKIRMSMLWAAAIWVGVAMAGTDEAQACAQFSRMNSIAWQVYNACGTVINVKWRDQGDCNGSGCSVGVRPGQIQSITPIQGRYQWCECQGSTCYPRC